MSHIQHAAEHNLPPCPRCSAEQGDPCRTPGWKTCRPHAERGGNKPPRRRAHGPSGFGGTAPIVHARDPGARGLYPLCGAAMNRGDSIHQPRRVRAVVPRLTATVGCENCKRLLKTEPSKTETPGDAPAPSAPPCAFGHAAVLPGVMRYADETVDRCATCEILALSTGPTAVLRDAGDRLGVAVTARPDGVGWYAFPQTWGSTALGHGGIGGQMMTSAITMVVVVQPGWHGDHPEGIALVYFGGAFAYSAKLTRAVEEAIATRRMPGKWERGKLR